MSLEPTALFLEALNWRYAVKKFDPKKILSAEQIDYVLEVFRLAPTSFGLQPYKLVVVSDPKLKQALFLQAGGQNQFKDCSHLLVFCALKQIDENYVDQYMQTIAETRNVKLETLQGFKNSILDWLNKLSPEEFLNWSKKQVYLALGMVLSACALDKIDSCPMEGFDAQQVSQILKLDTNLIPTVLCALGFRDSTDSLANLPKVRLAMDNLIKLI
jgi:nitroreductase